MIALTQSLNKDSLEAVHASRLSSEQLDCPPATTDRRTGAVYFIGLRQLFQGGDRFLCQRSRRGRVLAGDEAAINDDMGLPVGHGRVLGTLRR